MSGCIRALMPVLVSAIAGVLATVIVALACAWMPPPRSWQFSNEHTAKVPEYRGLACEISETERVVSMTGWGYGYRTVDIRYYDAVDVAAMRHPPVKRRAFLTQLGWPNAAFSTNSRTLANRFGVPANQMPSTSDLPYTSAGGSDAECLWSGFCFDAILFAMLFLGAWLIFRRPQRCCFLPCWAVLAACMGLWLALVASWACNLANQTINWWPREIAGFADPFEFAARIHAIEIPSSEQWDRFSGLLEESVGYRRWTGGFVKDLPNNRISSPSDASFLALGWPAFALRGSDIVVWSATGDTSPADTKVQHLIQMTALPVWWPGMAVNWVCYSLALVVLVRGPTLVRRAIRLRRNCCPACGYPMDKSPICSECGMELSTTNAAP